MEKRTEELSKELGKVGKEFEKGIKVLIDAYSRALAGYGKEKADSILEVVLELIVSDDFKIEAGKHINRYKRFSEPEQEGGNGS